MKIKYCKDKKVITEEWQLILKSEGTPLQIDTKQEALVQSATYWIFKNIAFLYLLYLFILLSRTEAFLLL